MQNFRTFIFNLLYPFYTGLICIIFIPFLILPNSWIRLLLVCWANGVRFLMFVILGLKVEVRGKQYLDGRPVLVAAKHQSSMETIFMPYLVGKAANVLKKELFYAPLYGWYVAKLGSIFVDRSAGMKSLKDMLDKAKKAVAKGHSVMLFPEGTRREIDAEPAYQPGVSLLYQDLGIDCVPVALNSGYFWSKKKKVKESGTIVIEFLPPIKAGLKRKEFMPLLETTIETATKKLVDEARSKASVV
jgi:1-acyl-sn-glycerol-3-phosphate acyltransferase